MAGSGMRLDCYPVHATLAKVFLWHFGEYEDYWPVSFLLNYFFVEFLWIFYMNCLQPNFLCKIFLKADNLCTCSRGLLK